MSDTAKIVFNNVVYENWLSIKVNKSLDTFSGSLSIEVKPDSGLSILPGHSCEFFINNVSVLSGFVDSVSPSASQGENSFTIIARDKTADLVDCSAVVASSEFTNTSFDRLCVQLLEPFGIRFLTTTLKAQTKIPKVSIQQETVFEVIEREARKLGLMVYADYSGNLVASEIGSISSSGSLVFPGSILSYRGNEDHSFRYSEYRVIAQQRSSSDLNSKQATQVIAKAFDKNVTRYRPLIIVGETAMTSQQAKDRVEWEASVRAARSQQMSVTVPGWAAPDGSLWSVNTLVTVDIQELGLLNKMLIKECSFDYNISTGQTTEIVLVDPDSFVPQPEIPKQSSSKRILPA